MEILNKIKEKLKFNYKLSDFLLSMLMWVFGGTLYFFMEVIYKSAIGHQAQISWTMIIVAMILCIPMERFGDNLPWEMPMYQQVLISFIGITVVEFISGLILNVWLGLNIWDYSNMPGNIMGQICPQFFIVWIILSYFGIKLFDWIRFSIIGGIKPVYSLFKKHSVNCKCVYCRDWDGKMYKIDTNHRDGIIHGLKYNKENLENELNELSEKEY